MQGTKRKLDRSIILETPYGNTIINPIEIKDFNCWPQQTFNPEENFWPLNVTLLNGVSKTFYFETEQERTNIIDKVYYLSIGR